MDVIWVGAGPALVIAVHGIQGTRAAWLPLARELQDTCTFVLPNLPGRGRAPRPCSPADCTLAAYARELQRTIQVHASGRPFILAGWSMGVSVALEYLYGGHANPDTPAPCGLILLSGTSQLNAVSWFESFAPDSLMEEIAARERRLGLTEAADHTTVAWTWQALRATDQRPSLGAIDIPAVVVHGSHDDDCPVAHAFNLANGLPNAELTMLDGGGHGLLTQNTAQVADAIRKQLDRLTRWPARPSSVSPLELP